MNHIRSLLNQTDNFADWYLQGIPLIHFISFISMDNDSMKYIKKIFTDIFVAQYKKISELYDANEN